MAVANQTLELDVATLRQAAKHNPVLKPYVLHLEMIQEGIERYCSDAVLWAVAYGSFLDLMETGKSGTSTRREKLFFVTNLDSIYESYELLAERVMGPALLEHGRMIDYEVWTLEEFLSASKRGTSDLLRKVLPRNVTLFGSPPEPSAGRLARSTAIFLHVTF